MKTSHRRIALVVGFLAVCGLSLTYPIKNIGSNPDESTDQVFLADLPQPGQHLARAILQENSCRQLLLVYLPTTQGSALTPNALSTIGYIETTESGCVLPANPTLQRAEIINGQGVTARAAIEGGSETTIKFRL